MPCQIYFKNCRKQYFKINVNLAQNRLKKFIAVISEKNLYIICKYVIKIRFFNGN